MAQRDSGYRRKPRDSYDTPAWVTHCLLPHVRRVKRVWEPAAGRGMMVRALCEAGVDVVATKADFLCASQSPPRVRGIITNPPYKHATEFIEIALALMRPRQGFVAMLLRSDFDHAITRRHLFCDCPAFAKRVILTSRIVWFKGPAGPSENHTWFIWDHQHRGPPTAAYAHKQEQQS